MIIVPRPVLCLSNRSHSYRSALAQLGIAILALAFLVVPSLADSPPPLIQYGGMRLALAQGQNEARISLSDAVAIEHFFGVGAMAGLEGEITILDSHAFATTYGDRGSLVAADPSGVSATILVGQSVAAWSETVLEASVSPAKFDQTIREAAQASGLDPATPFAFVIEGDVTDVRLHVIHGACPVHARMNKLEIPADQAPYELEVDRISGTVVGIYAEDAVGKLTHPATSTHAHLIFVDSESGEQLTAHLEKVGIAEGARIRVPRVE
ncbi:MAG: acetolactate decarboxylase [Candidatus Eisenbacteria bacterium]|nr:acetolactate decarboxylase [Candidatus Eisenbacteria bacterium]